MSLPLMLPCAGPLTWQVLPGKPPTTSVRSDAVTRARTRSFTLLSFSRIRAPFCENFVAPRLNGARAAVFVEETEQSNDHAAVLNERSFIIVLSSSAALN